MEFNENDLNNVVGGIDREIAAEKLSKLFKEIKNAEKNGVMSTDDIMDQFEQLEPINIHHPDPIIDNMPESKIDPEKDIENVPDPITDDSKFRPILEPESKTSMPDKSLDEAIESFDWETAFKEAEENNKTNSELSEEDLEKYLGGIPQGAYQDEEFMEKHR